MPKFQPNAPLSLIRLRLKEAIAARADADSKLAALTAAIAKLECEVAAVEPAESVLARMQAANAERMLTWADAGDGSSPPAVDEPEFTAVTKALDSARASAAAAAQAKASLEARYVSIANSVPSIEAAISVAVAEVIEEASAPLIEQAVEAARLLAQLQERVVQGVDTVRTLSTSLNPSSPAMLAATATSAALRPRWAQFLSLGQT